MFYGALLCYFILAGIVEGKLGVCFAPELTKQMTS
jgi:hypothetical protein